MKYDVHLYPVMRVKVCGIEAESQKEAMEKAYSTVDLHALFDPRRFVLYPGIDTVEFAEEIAYYLVDEQDDEEYEGSQWYESDFSPMLEGKSKQEQLSELVDMIARMKTEAEFGNDQPPFEDWICTLNDLIESARKISGVDPGYKQLLDEFGEPIED